MEHLVEPEQLLPLPLLQPADRDPGPAGHDVGDLLLGDHLPEKAMVSLLGGEPHLQIAQLALQLGQLPVTELGRPVQVVAPLGILGLTMLALDLRP